jgi:hypothetical protein
MTLVSLLSRAAAADCHLVLEGDVATCREDAPPETTDERMQGAFTASVAVGPHVGWLRAAPALALDHPGTTGVPLSRGGSIGLTGLDVGARLRWGRLVIFGPYYSFGNSNLGAPLREGRVRVTAFDISLGLGWEHVTRGWTFTGNLRAGASTIVDKTVVQGTEVSGDRTRFGLHAEIEACRILAFGEPRMRVNRVPKRGVAALSACGFAAPTLYDFGWVNGGLVGLRLAGELGD